MGLPSSDELEESELSSKSSIGSEFSSAERAIRARFESGRSESRLEGKIRGFGFMTSLLGVGWVISRSSSTFVALRSRWISPQPERRNAYTMQCINNKDALINITLLEPDPLVKKLQILGDLFQ